MGDKLRALAAEFAGTFIIVFVGVGVVHSAVLTGSFSGLGQVAAVWGAGVCLAILVAAARSGAHLNPAITVALAAYRRFSPATAATYVVCQLLGAAMAATLLYGMFASPIRDFEQKEGIVRGKPGSERSAMMYGEYFPNPAGGLDAATVGKRMAFAAEAAGTAVLALVIFALTDPGRRDKPSPAGTAAAIGATVAVMICLVAPLTQAGLNPARDMGPRMVAWLMGWGDVAIPGPRGGWLAVYVAGPVAGALVGAGIYELFLRQKCEAKGGC